MTRPPLPPLSTLRAFEAAGRLGSFRDAAAELSLTPSAISHQVKALERWLGAALFERTPRLVRLTAAGRALSRDASAAFDRLAHGGARIRARTETHRLRVSALPLFTNVWLVPRLARFEAMHPDAAIDIETTNRVVDLLAGDIDVAIRNTFAPTPGLAARKLLDVKATPLCTPRLAQGLRKPADLARATLIHISARKEGWPQWFEQAGVAGLAAKRRLSFDTIPSALEATLQGRGIMLGLIPLVWDAPGARDLVAPYDIAISAGTYFLVHRRSPRALALAFADWVSAEMKADARRLSKLSSRSRD